MKVFLFIFATLFLNSECFLGDSYYTSLINQWKFAYNIISDTTIDYTAVSKPSELQNSIEGGTNASSEPQTVFLNDLDINWSEIPNSAFVVPLVSYPIAIIYNSPLLSEPLKLTRPLLYRILTTLVTWNDPELVALNPGLTTVSATVRVTLNQEPSTVNQYIIDYIFQDVNISSDQVEYGSWIGLVALHHRLSVDYSKVLFSVTATANAMAFIPWPLTTSTSSGLTPAQLVSTNNNTITIDDVSPPTINRIQSGQTQITLERSEDTWPMNVIGYLLFDQDKIDCSSIQENVRFFYWSCNNTNLINTTLIEGFKMVNPNATGDLMESNCSGNRILQYENLSKASRSEFLLGFSITLVMIFIGMIFFRFYQARKNMTMQEKRKYRFRSAFHSGIIIFGLILFLVGAIIWYFPASDDWICISRMVFSGLGICFVISSAFMYAFAFARNIRGQGKEEKLQVRVVFITCLLVSILEGLLLLFWMIFDQPQAAEVVQDAIEWKSRYVCQSDSNIPEIIQYVYFCIIIIYGCVEVNHYWKEKGILDPRLILGSLYSELLIFIILIVMSTLIEFTDENLYIVKVSLYLMAIGNISGAWFMQSFIRWISELKKNSSGSKNDQSQMHTMNTVSSINATVLETAESRRSSSAADLPE